MIYISEYVPSNCYWLFLYNGLVWRNLHRQVNNNEYAPKSQYWQIYFKGSIQINLAWWIYIDDCTPVGKYWWPTLTSWYSQIYPSVYLYHIIEWQIDNEQSITMSQYLWIYILVSILTNLPQCVDMNKYNPVDQYWPNYIDGSMLTNVLWQVNIDESTP